MCIRNDPDAAIQKLANAILPLVELVRNSRFVTSDSVQAPVSAGRRVGFPSDQYHQGAAPHDVAEFHGYSRGSRKTKIASSTIAAITKMTRPAKLGCTAQPSSWQACRQRTGPASQSAHRSVWHATEQP